MGKYWCFGTLCYHLLIYWIFYSVHANIYITTMLLLLILIFSTKLHIVYDAVQDTDPYIFTILQLKLIFN